MTEKNEKVTEEKVTEKKEVAEKKNTALTTASAFEEDAGGGLGPRGRLSSAAP